MVTLTSLPRSPECCSSGPERGKGHGKDCGGLRGLGVDEANLLSVYLLLERTRLHRHLLLQGS
jgi:hypothetical protein